MRRGLLVPIAVAVCTFMFAAPALAASKDDAAVDALKMQMLMVTRGQYGKAWQQIHPAQQAVVDRDEYVLCGSRQTSGVEITDFDTIDVYREKVQIPGTDVKAKSWAITAKIGLRQGSATDTLTHTYHEFLVSGKWRFALDDPEKATTC